MVGITLRAGRRVAALVSVALAAAVVIVPGAHAVTGAFEVACPTTAIIGAPLILSISGADPAWTTVTIEADVDGTWTSVGDVPIVDGAGTATWSTGNYALLDAALAQTSGGLGWRASNAGTTSATCETTLTAPTVTTQVSATTVGWYEPYWASASGEPGLDSSAWVGVETRAADGQWLAVRSVQYAQSNGAYAAMSSKNVGIQTFRSALTMGGRTLALGAEVSIEVLAPVLEISAPSVLYAQASWRVTGTILKQDGTPAGALASHQLLGQAYDLASGTWGTPSDIYSWVNTASVPGVHTYRAVVLNNGAVQYASDPVTVTILDPPPPTIVDYPHSVDGPGDISITFAAPMQGECYLERSDGNGWGVVDQGSCGQGGAGSTDVLSGHVDDNSQFRVRFANGGVLQPTSAPVTVLVYFTSPSWTVTGATTDVTWGWLKWGGTGDVGQVTPEYLFHGGWVPMPDLTQTVVDGRSYWTLPDIADRNVRFASAYGGETVYSTPIMFYTFGSRFPTHPPISLNSPDAVAPGAAASVDVHWGGTASDAKRTWIEILDPATGQYSPLPGFFPMSGGAGTITFTPNGPARYVVCIDYGQGFSGCSGAFDIAVRTLTLSGPSTYVPGAAVPLTLSVDPAMSGVAMLEHRYGTGPWLTTTIQVLVTNGVGAIDVHPRDVKSYRLVMDGAVSNAVEVSPIVPTLTLSGPSTYVPGAAVPLTLSVDPAMSGTAMLEHRYGTGPWLTTTIAVPVTNGAGTFDAHPRGVKSYRLAMDGAVSNAVEVTPIVPTLTLSGASTYVPGGDVLLTLHVDPTLSGTAMLEHRYGTGPWLTTTIAVPVTNGVGTFDAHPRGVKSYRLVMAGGVSNAVQVSPIVPTLTLSGASTYVPGAAVPLTLHVDPAVSGVAMVEHRYGTGPWLTTTIAVPVTNGVGTFDAHPRDVKSYRLTMGGAVSNAVQVSPAG